MTARARQPSAGERDVDDRSLRRHDGAETNGESWFRSLLQHASELMLVWDARGEITYASPAAIRFAHGPDADPERRTIQQTADDIHPDDVDEVRERVRSLAARPGETDRYVARYRRHDGEYRTLDVTISNLLHEPSVRGMVANSRDVTDELEVQDTLRANERRYMTLVEHSSDVISVVDVDGMLHYASPSIERVLGYAPEKIAGMNTADILHPDDLDVALSMLARLIEDPATSTRAELRLRHADGSWRSIEIAASNRLDDPAIKGIVVNNHDVTDRRQAEEAQRASERWFRGLVQRGYDIIVVSDAEGLTRYVSPSVEHVLGYKPEELLGEIGTLLLHPDDMATLATFFTAVTSTPGFVAPIEMRARHADGSWRWVEAVYSNQLEDDVINGIVMNFRDVTERKVVEEQLAHQALHDVLTQLPNRVLLADRLGQAIARAGRSESQVGIVFLDLDRFKLVNDTRGHTAGDTLLAAVAERLSNATRASDTVARFGGDEFVVIYENVGSAPELVSLAERLCSTLSDPFEIDGEEVFVTVSAGAALSDPSSEPAGLLRDADAAMYFAKERGGGTVAVFDESIGIRANTRFETDRALRHALERDELTLVYQPIVALESGQIVGTEALLRWEHPELGTVAPGEFIELAEETGLVTPIGIQTLERACRQAVEWRTYPGLSQLEISVNISGVQLRDRGFASVVADILNRVGLDPKSLMLEITESFLVEHTQACLETLAELEDLGVCLALDDFGTRYSSLGYLNSIPVEALKIDRSFVDRLGADPGNTAIVSAIVAMATALGLNVIAEGVETREQHAQLVELGCRFGQGYWLSRPLGVDDASELLRAGRIPTEPLGEHAASS